LQHPATHPEQIAPPEPRSPRLPALPNPRVILMPAGLASIWHMSLGSLPSDRSCSSPQPGMILTRSPRARPSRSAAAIVRSVSWPLT
jgi:hypothetical protein